MRRYPIRYGTGGVEQGGFTKNFSPEGVAVIGRNIYPKGAVLSLLLSGDESEIRMTGEVRWTSDPKTQLAMGQMSEMGIRIVSRDQHYVDLVEKLILESRKRQEPRFEKNFKVIYDNPGVVAEDHSRDISLGGMFVITDNPAPLNSTIGLRIVLIDAFEAISIQCRVVHIMSGEVAERMGCQPGMGVQFESFDDDDRERFYRYIDELKREYGIS